MDLNEGIHLVFRVFNPLAQHRYRALGEVLRQLLVATIAFALPVSASPAPAGNAGPEGVIVAMGDSLTEGYGVLEKEAYPALLQEMLSEKGYRFPVVNAGVSGETSSGALSRIRWVLRLKPDIVILETGANDGLRGIDPAVTEQNIAQILGVLKKEKITVVLAGMKMVVNMGKTYTDSFEKIYPSLARRFDVTLIPFFLDGVAAIPSLNSGDGIHPNAAGYKVLVQNIFPYVTDAVESWRRAEVKGQPRRSVHFRTEFDPH
jgi:acyl-CoA thioesterase I